MRTTGKQIHGFGVGELIAFFTQELYITGQGGRVAGDIDHLFGAHGVNGFNDIGAHALSRRVYDDNIGTVSLLAQLLCCLTCIGAEELCVCDPVSICILLGIFDGGIDHLYTDDLFGFPCEAQGNGAGATVQV